MKSEADEADSINDFEIELKRWNWDGLLDMELEYFHRILSMAELSEKSAPIQAPM